jgi:hypothetical protein
MPVLWTVETALDEIADAINGGSVKLDLDELTRKQVKDLYRKDFEALSKDDWNNLRAKVLEMADMAGSSSEMATIVQWVDGIGTVGKSLDRETVLLVCVMVSRLHCTLLKGAICPDVAYTEPKGKKLDEILKELGAPG